MGSAGTEELCAEGADPDLKDIKYLRSPPRWNSNELEKYEVSVASSATAKCSPGEIHGNPLVELIGIPRQPVASPDSSTGTTGCLH